MKKTISTSLLFWILFIASFSASAKLFDFEDLPDSASVTDQYVADGVSFANTIALTSGFSLNEIDYPPYSGKVVVGDDGNGPVEINFSNLTNNVSAYFTYSTQLTINVYGENSSFLGSINSATSSNLGSNTLISIAYQGIKRLQISGESPESFVMDNLQPVPEPDEYALFGVGFLAIYIRLGYHRRKLG